MPDARQVSFQFSGTRQRNNSSSNQSPIGNASTRSPASGGEHRDHFKAPLPLKRSFPLDASIAPSSKKAFNFGRAADTSPFFNSQSQKVTGHPPAAAGANSAPTPNEAIAQDENHDSELHASDDAAIDHGDEYAMPHEGHEARRDSVSSNTSVFAYPSSNSNTSAIIEPNDDHHINELSKATAYFSQRAIETSQKISSLQDRNNQLEVCYRDRNRSVAELKKLIEKLNEQLAEREASVTKIDSR